MYSSRSVALVVISVVFPVLAMIVVALRIQARLIKKLNLGVDDYFILLALVVTIAASVPYIIGASSGAIGEHIEDVDGPTALTFGKVMFALQFFYIGPVALVKISILFFYKRIFITPRFRAAANVMIAAVVLWLVAFFFATLFQAWPISYNWDGVGTATNYWVIYWTAAATDIFLDIITLCMPLSMIRSLNTSTRNKVQLAGIFGLGAFICVSSIVRLAYLVQFNDVATGASPNGNGPGDFTYSCALMVTWSEIEPCTSIIAACLPSLGPIFGQNSLRTLVGSIKRILSSMSSPSLLGRRSEKSYGSSRTGSVGFAQMVDGASLGETKPRAESVEMC